MARRRSLIMNATEMLQRIGESLGSTATVKSVFGEPIHVEGKTVVPVAKVAYGFGAGGGSGTRGSGEGGEGGGGGGGVRAFPAGVLEITAENTHFIPFTDARRLALAFAAGIALGAMVFGRRLRD
jgi:uncharacterized spore protein YtfJ